MEKKATQKTRWQLRVDADLERKIREMSEKEHRSINQTVIYIIEEYFKCPKCNKRER